MFSIVFSGIIVFFLLTTGQAFQCPNETSYISILNMGCFKVYTGVNATWDIARQSCENDTKSMNQGIAHLLSIEHQMKMNAISNWLQAYQLFQSFWISGDLLSSEWTWSNQSITWFFDAEYRAIIGNGTKYKLIYNNNLPGLLKYQISDDVATTSMTYICEYQVRCNGSSTCQNNAQCYVNMGQDLCICAPGFTGDLCEININECLSSPCLYGGNCTDGINNYTCDCSDTYHEGRNCETEQADPTKSDRKTAFWSVLGVVTGLVVFLTLSDLPWEDIMSALGCSFHCFNCCSKKPKNKDSNENDRGQIDSPIIYEGYDGKKSSISDGMAAPRTTNYQIMNTGWQPDHSDRRTKSTSPVVPYQQNQQIYAVNVNQPKPRSNNSVDAMVNWSQQLQQQLKTKQTRESSASSTKQLIHKTYSTDA